jgi:hypothetical protein
MDLQPEENRVSDPENRDKRRTGQVRHDSGGRAIWEWALESGRHAVDSTSRLLKKLDLSNISLLNDDERPWEKKSGAKPDEPELRIREPDEALPLQKQLEKEPPASRGFNPYDTRTPTGRGVTFTPKPPPKPRITQPPAPPRRKKGFWARLFSRD